MRKKSNYESGYAKPPKSGQFKRGQSGNPKGRPKGSKDFRTDLRDVLDAKVAVTEDGKSRKVTSQKATLMRLREQALQGNQRAMSKLIDLAKEQGAEEWSLKVERVLSNSEQAILERYKSQVVATSAANAADGTTRPEPDHEATDDE